MIKLPALPNTHLSTSILEQTTLRERIDVLLATDRRVIQWHAVNRLSYLLERRGGSDAPIVLVQITLDDSGDPTPTTYPPIDISRAMSETGVILWEYRKGKDKPAVITAWYFTD